MTGGGGALDRHYGKHESSWHVYLRQVAQGDSTALSALYDGTSTIVFSVAQSILRNSADAEEITLDVYLYVWRAADAYDPSRGAVATWLTMLARSRALGRLRSLAAQYNNNSNRNVPIERLSQQVPGNGTAKRGDERILIEAALDKLPVDQRELIELAFFSGLTHQELAWKLGIPLGTVKSRARAALSQLRDLLAITHA